MVLPGSGHSQERMSRTSSLAAEREIRGSSVPAHTPAVYRSFDSLYESNLEFVWRTLLRLGVPHSKVDDAAQDAFLVVHRKLATFEYRSSLRTWLYGIAVRVARDYRRALKRKGKALGRDSGDDPDSLPASAGVDASAMTDRFDAVHTLEQLMEHIGEERREVFQLTELEQMTAPEVAEALGLRLPTVHSRLRVARLEFQRAIAQRQELREGGLNDPK